MTTFLERWQGRVRSLATFGDSVTQALHIAPPDVRWANRLAQLLGATLLNHGISGTVLQGSPDASGQPRRDNGYSRFTQALLGSDRADVIAILYGTNDARYTAAPATLNHAGFVRDYRAILAGLFSAGYGADAIVVGSPSYMPDAGFAVGAEDGFAGQSRAVYQGYVTTVQQIARDTGAFYAAVNERLTAEGGDTLILPDHVHPNDRGHAVIAAAFAGARQL